MLYFLMSNIKIAFSVNETEGTSPEVCGTWEHSAQIISFKHRLCLLSLKTPNHKRPLETDRSAGRPEESSNQTLVEGTSGVPQSGYARRMSVKLLLKLNIGYSRHNPCKKPEPALIQNTTHDADKKDGN